MVVMNSSSPANVQLETWCAGVSTTPSSSPSGRVAPDLAAEDRRRPQAALVVDAHPVRSALAARDRHEPPAVGDRARVEVVVEGVDAQRRRVGEVERRAVGAPVQPVGEPARPPRSGVSVPSGSRRHELPRLGEVEHHRPGEQPAARVDLAVVEAGRRAAEVQARDRLERAVVGQDAELVPDHREQPALAARHHRAGRVGRLPRGAGGPAVAVAAQLVDAPAVDVAPDETVVRRVVGRALAQHVVPVEHRRRLCQDPHRGGDHTAHPV